MKVRTLTLAAIVTSTAVAVVGCSGGGSSGGGSGSVAPPATVGQITSGLETPNRATSYSFQTYYSPSSIPGGAVTAIEAAPVGTAVLAADAPFSNVNLVDNGAGTQEAKFYFDASSFASIGTNVFAATANRDAPGAGDVWMRDAATSTWSLALDSSENEAVVAALGSHIYAAMGSVNGGTDVQAFDTRNAAGGFSSVATIESVIPTSAEAYKGELWVGTTGNGQTGGGAQLFHGAGTTFDELKLPIPAVGKNVYQRVTDLLSIATVASGATTGLEFLVVAVGEFDINGQPISGSVMITDGEKVERLHQLKDDAPTALAWADGTIYVATREGALQWRDKDGDFQDEPSLPTTDGIVALYARQGELFIGAHGATGATLILRSTGGVTPPPPPPPPSTDRFYVDDVAPLMAQLCASCHDGTLPAAAAAFALSSPVDMQADHTEVLTKIDQGSPADSLLLLKAAGDSSVGGHVGGALIAVGSANYNTILTWISQGARYENVTTPPPPPVVKKTFALDVHPLLRQDCQGCHGGGAGGFTINANVDTSYNNSVARVNMTTPELSLLLRKPSMDGVAHGGGSPTGWGKGEAKYNAVVQWIADGTLKN